VAISRDQGSFASLALTVMNPIIGQYISPTITVGISSYQVLIETGVVIENESKK
jgi:hypothetical protein